LRVQMSGSLSAFTSGFLDDLSRHGYRPGTAAKQLQLMAHLSRWLTEHDLEPAGLGGAQIERFVEDRRASHTQLASADALKPLLGYLRGLDVVPPAGSREAPTPAGALLDRYTEYLLVRRGLKASTVRNYCNHARDFLTDRERRLGHLALGALDVAAINEYVLRESRRVSVCSTQAAALALRSLLRFLQLAGLIDADLAVAVPSVAKWRLASLVRALDAAFLTQLLDSCDRRASIGRGDFAILMLLSRLGLRIGEVAALRLEDLDWRAGELVINGKGGRYERLPLPADVGEAIVDWLCDGRPDCDSRSVFIRSRAPHLGLHPSSLNDVVHRACLLYHYAALRHPEHAATIARVLAIPAKRHDRGIVNYLNEQETTALLAAPDRSRWIGRRDHALLTLAVQTGLRVSELTALRCRDAHLTDAPHMQTLGKGRKQRITPLPRHTTDVLRTWTKERAGGPDDPLFLTARGRALSRDAIALIVERHTKTASHTCPTLATKTVSPHVLRHTTGINLLHAGVDTIATRARLLRVNLRISLYLKVRVRCAKSSRAGSQSTLAFIAVGWCGLAGGTPATLGGSRGHDRQLPQRTW